MILVADTTIWIAELRAEPGVEFLDTALARNANVFATDIVCAELLAAPQRDQQEQLVEFLREGRRILYLQRHLDVVSAADCMRATRLAGRTVRSMTDCLIAAVCIREELPLLHNDRDFDTLADLTDLEVVRI